MQPVLVNAFPAMSMITDALRGVCNQESNSGKSHGHMPCKAACSLMVSACSLMVYACSLMVSACSVLVYAMALE